MPAPASTAEWIPEIVDRLVREFDPVRIMLFGSHARGDASDGSDLDFLVVLPRIDDTRAAGHAMRAVLRGVPVSADVFAVDVEEISRTGDSVGSFVYPVLREGRVVYGVDERDEHTWLRYAEEDLQTAERMLAGRGFALRWACYLAQQAAEKVLRAVLVRDAIQCAYIHDLRKLQDLVPGGRRVSGLDVDVEWLSRWTTVARYPDPVQEATERDARRAVDVAGAVVQAVKEDLRA